ncbi:MAG: plasmid maintenance system killer [Candidatus Lambdaproteobacteria bacterium RIFOXYD2_FULL_50_16]|uniref:Plasmid maintenance system killer n=1 Tax=Candidatus Lambdaproteobacteria bacterium RIFOXYD2_FULL_50_16 TaxID=1817772 RepID=A0A1F6G4N8_9PROT|nr:MAG: plasmid maintenance system killer [Candidatus Lambdaproteobacteria bacterium RIFOXYD2_FULL_50_16]
MIKSFQDKQTEKISQGDRVKALPPQIAKRALMRLQRIDAALTLDDLLGPPSHRLEALKGDLAGFYSIRINEQWRVVFRFESGQAFDVKITDYH